MIGGDRLFHHPYPTLHLDTKPPSHDCRTRPRARTLHRAGLHWYPLVDILMSTPRTQRPVAYSNLSLAMALWPSSVLTNFATHPRACCIVSGLPRAIGRTCAQYRATWSCLPFRAKQIIHIPENCNFQVLSQDMCDPSSDALPGMNAGNCAERAGRMPADIGLTTSAGRCARVTCHHGRGRSPCPYAKRLLRMPICPPCALVSCGRPHRYPPATTTPDTRAHVHTLPAACKP